MDLSKYYKPDISEIFIGQSILGRMDDEWYQLDINELDLHSIDDIKELIEEGSILIKYLDSKDIVELGWSYIGYHWYNSIKDSKLRLSFIDHKELVFISYSPSSFTYGDEENIFRGKIKNKAELAKLMEQLEI